MGGPGLTPGPEPPGWLHPGPHESSPPGDVVLSGWWGAQRRHCEVTGRGDVWGAAACASHPKAGVAAPQTSGHAPLAGSRRARRDPVPQQVSTASREAGTRRWSLPPGIGVHLLSRPWAPCGGHRLDDRLRPRAGAALGRGHADLRARGLCRLLLGTGRGGRGRGPVSVCLNEPHL